jgi:hypothetical protein
MSVVALLLLLRKILLKLAVKTAKLIIHLTVYPRRNCFRKANVNLEHLIILRRILSPGM